MSVQKTKKKQTEDEQDNQGLLLPLNIYLASGIHIGMKYKTRMMGDYIYKIREDGLTILNIQKINERIALASKFLAQFSPERILIVGRRESAKKAVKTFSKITGIKEMTGRYYPGTLTNPSFPKYMECSVILVADPWNDKNAVKDANTINIPIISLSDSNNSTQNIDMVIPCNNKGKKSMEIIFFLLAREYLKNRKLIKSDSEFEYKLDDFADEEDNGKELPKKEELHNSNI